MRLIILVAWVYVVLMLAVTQDSAAAGAAMLFFLGVAPIWFFAWVARKKLQQRRRALQEKDGQA
ncbi:hypothetical protein CEK28_05550 [Xenophilus sp. AP218F]|nr:hypothetical protein [Chromobacterium sp. ASV5]OWY40195.1 hypothetical protein CEK28_05550 [Xenophilus sp. AP218F]